MSAEFFFFNDTATTEIYTLSLHDALPIYTSVWPDAEIHGTTRYGAEDPAREGQALTVSWRLGDTEYLGLNGGKQDWTLDRKSTRLNSSHANISYAVFCLKKKK